MSMDKHSCCVQVFFYTEGLLLDILSVCRSLLYAAT